MGSIGGGGRCGKRAMVGNDFIWGGQEAARQRRWVHGLGARALGVALGHAV